MEFSADNVNKTFIEKENNLTNLQNFKSFVFGVVGEGRVESLPPYCRFFVTPRADSPSGRIVPEWMFN